MGVLILRVLRLMFLWVLGLNMTLRSTVSRLRSIPPLVWWWGRRSKVLHLRSLWHWCGSGKAKPWSHGSSYQGVWEAVVLVEVLVLQGHVAVVDGDGQLAFAEQPLLSQIVVDLIPGL